eukprot:scaffold591635_cov29-Prasinocladus_malaysianus.AAC.1
MAAANPNAATPGLHATTNGTNDKIKQQMKFGSADAEVYFTVGTEPYEKWVAYYRKQSRHAKIESGQPYHF